MRQRWPRLAGVAAAAALLVGCPAAEPCRPQLVLQPTPDANGILEVPENRATPMRARLELCDADPLQYTFAWYYDEDGDGRLSTTEREQPVAQSPEFQLFACYTDRGDHPLQVVAEPISAELDPERYPRLTVEATVRVVSGAGASERPACYEDALAAVRGAGFIDASSAATFESVVACLDPYLEENLCDFQAAYASGLAHFTLFTLRLPERFVNRNQMSVADVEAIFADEVVPILDRFMLVARKAPEDFSFYVDGTYRITAFEDLPYLAGDETLYLVFQGEHDIADVYAEGAMANGIRGAFEMALAYRGLIRFALDVPRLDTVDFRYFRREGIRRMVADPTFMTIDEEGDPDGYRRLLLARGAFMDAIAFLQRAVQAVRAETDAQKDDLLRYWDCGSDGICDCSDTSEILFACPNAPGDYQGPDEDGTEGNGRYDPGEPVGTDRIGFPEFFTVDLPSDIDEFIRQIGMIRDNLRGPDALDLDKLAGAPVSLALKSVGIPYPEIRLSEWFLTPSHPRDLAPLYSKSKLDVIFEIESEPFWDVGYDGVPNAQEKVILADNPRELPVGTPYDKATNPDPHFDDLNPFCNPVCNFNDGIDNDGDGLTDWADRFVSGGFDAPLDLGVEGNLVFDWVDLNDNFAHDPGEASEPFTDVGVLNHQGQTIGANNGKWDFADREHVYPTGEDVGPFGDLERVDPPDGTADDAQIRVALPQLAGTELSPQQLEALRYPGLFDTYYFFYPDPTFSGVLQFPEEIQSIDGRLLTENAKFQRFVNKILELIAVTRIGKRSGDGAAASPREGFGHPCSDPDACSQAVQRLGGTP